jgi:hypothetical protein
VKLIKFGDRVGNVGGKTMSTGLYRKNNNRIVIIIQKYTEWSRKKEKIGEKNVKKRRYMDLSYKVKQLNDDKIMSGVYQ